MSARQTSPPGRNVNAWTNKRLSVRQLHFYMRDHPTVTVTMCKHQAGDRGLVSVMRLTVHLSHGSDVVVWIFEADEAVAFGLSCSFVSHHLMWFCDVFTCSWHTHRQTHKHSDKANIIEWIRVCVHVSVYDQVWLNCPSVQHYCCLLTHGCE